MLDPRLLRGLQVEVEALALLVGAEPVKDPLEGDAHAADGGAALVAVRIVGLGERAQHGRCGAGDVERDALMGGQVAEPR